MFNKLNTKLTPYNVKKEKINLLKSLFKKINIKPHQYLI